MADWGITPGTTGVTEEDRFFKWLKSKYGWLRASLFDFTDWQNSGEYWGWVKQGRPTAVTPVTTPTGTETTVTTMPATAEAGEGKLLTDEEEAELARIAGGLEPTWWERWQSQQPTATDWQGTAEGLALEREKLAWEKEQGNLTDIKAQFQMELQFEKDRNALINALPSDDWIRRWTMTNQPNPYRAARLDREQRTVGSQLQAGVTALESTLDRQTAEVQNLTVQVANMFQTGDTSTAFDQAADKLAKARETRTATYDLWNKTKKESEDWTPQPPEAVAQPYPNAPEWLPQYVPGLAAGQMITKQNIPTPSGQQLTRMPVSQAGQLGSYADWAANYTGQRQWKDILGEAKLVQPTTPFGRTRWQPSYQGRG